MGICLNKQKLMYKVLAPSTHKNSYGLMKALCVRGWLSDKEGGKIGTKATIEQNFDYLWLTNERAEDVPPLMEKTEIKVQKENTNKKEM